MEGVCSGEQYVQKYVSKSQGSTCYKFLNQTFILFLCLGPFTNLFLDFKLVNTY